jgi:Flp pilus assembly protein CpaB
VPAPENGRPVVNVIVKPEDAETLALADSAGRIRLVLRHPKDDAIRSAGPLSLSTLLRPAPGRRPDAPPEVAARR